MKAYNIRELRTNEYDILEGLVYEAIFQVSGATPLPKEIIYKPQIYAYIKDFGKRKDDYCLVAEMKGKIIGGIWVRITDGYGNVDKETPELAISLYA